MLESMSSLPSVRQMSTLDDPPSMALITRRDLRLSRGKLVAQCAHAAVKCALRARSKKTRLEERWSKSGARKIVLEVEDEAALWRLKDCAKEFGVIAMIIQDAGHTEIPAGTVTVLGLGPAPRNVIDELVRDLRLVS